jgi:hypothetical protein
MQEVMDEEVMDEEVPDEESATTGFQIDKCDCLFETFPQLPQPK